MKWKHVHKILLGPHRSLPNVAIKSRLTPIAIINTKSQATNLLLPLLLYIQQPLWGICEKLRGRFWELSEKANINYIIEQMSAVKQRGRDRERGS